MHRMSLRQLGELYTIAPGARVLRERDILRDPGLLGSVEVSYHHLPPGLWVHARRLRWMQSIWAGMDGLLRNPQARGHPAVFTNARIHAEPIGNHLFAMLLALSRALPTALQNQQKREWNIPAVEEGVFTLAGRTLCIAGLGEIGRRCAALGKALGMRVIGIRREGGACEGVEEVFAAADRREAFRRAHVIMLVLPGTEETRGFVSEPEFSAMRQAVLLNAGRGNAVDTPALLDALESGRVRACGLDVTDPEPLPRDHPLWNMANVILTPHVSGKHPEYDENAGRVFLDNLRRYVGGEPLRWVVDKERGY
jgi:D-2-hydroxyacid dehydrogenase (NADP+)